MGILPLSLPIATSPHCHAFILFIFFYLPDTGSHAEHDRNWFFACTHKVPRLLNTGVRAQDRPFVRPNTQNCHELTSQ